MFNPSRVLSGGAVSRPPSVMSNWRLRAGLSRVHIILVFINESLLIINSNKENLQLFQLLKEGVGDMILWCSYNCQGTTGHIGVTCLQSLGSFSGNKQNTEKKNT